MLDITVIIWQSWLKCALLNVELDLKYKGN